MIRRAIRFTSSLSLLLLVTLSVVSLRGTCVGHVRTVGSLTTYTNRGGNLGLAVFTDSSFDPTGRVFDPWMETEIVAVNLGTLPRRPYWGGLVVSPMPIAAPTLSAHVVFVPWRLWVAALALLPACRLAAWGYRLVRRLRRP
jgi:hypothetical protein